MRITFKVDKVNTKYNYNQKFIRILGKLILLIAVIIWILTCLINHLLYGGMRKVLIEYNTGQRCTAYITNQDFEDYWKGSKQLITKSKTINTSEIKAIVEIDNQYK